MAIKIVQTDAMLHGTIYKLPVRHAISRWYDSCQLEEEINRMSIKELDWDMLPFESPSCWAIQRHWLDETRDCARGKEKANPKMAVSQPTRKQLLAGYGWGWEVRGGID